MESTECIAAQVTARTILLHSSRCAALVAVRTADSTPAGVSRTVAVVVMGLLNQPPPTVLSASDPVVHRVFRDFRRSFGEVSIRSLALATRPPKAGSFFGHRVRRRRPPQPASLPTTEQRRRTEQSTRHSVVE